MINRYLLYFFAIIVVCLCIPGCGRNNASSSQVKGNQTALSQDLMIPSYPGAKQQGKISVVNNIPQLGEGIRAIFVTPDKIEKVENFYTFYRESEWTAYMHEEAGGKGSAGYGINPTGDMEYNFKTDPTGLILVSMKTQEDGSTRITITRYPDSEKRN